jgi:spore coat polysaccharide biosynthesis protein SpsF
LLEIAAREAEDAAEREHVTAFLYRRPARFRIGAVVPTDHDRPGLRLCVDTPEDFALVTRILEALVPQDPLFRWADIARILDANPEWPRVNAAIVQKPT